MGISNTLDKYPTTQNGGILFHKLYGTANATAKWVDNVPFYDSFRLGDKKTPGYNNTHTVWVSETTGAVWQMLSPDLFYLLHNADIIGGKATGWWRAIDRGAYGLEYVLPENLNKGVHLPKQLLDDSSLMEYAKFNTVQ
jgi:hypothetical protein